MKNQRNYGDQETHMRETLGINRKKISKKYYEFIIMKIN